MANVIYRDIDCANGHAAIYAILSRLVLNGWTTVASSDGSSRTTSAPGSAASLNNSDAWWLVQHTASGRKLGIQRKTDSNTWTVQVTPGGYSLSTGSATAMDSHATYTKSLRSSYQCYPSTGTTATKLHMVVDDARCGFVAFLRRTPLPGGLDGCFGLVVEDFTDLTWPANPDPCVYAAVFRNGDDLGAGLLGLSFGCWYKLGIGGEIWYTASTGLENPGSVCGSGTASPSGTDQLLELRWANGGAVVLYGKSTLIRGLQPYRSTTVGVDSGGTLNWAAFGAIAVPNDGTALGS